MNICLKDLLYWTMILAKTYTQLSPSTETSRAWASLIILQIIQSGVPIHSKTGWVQILKKMKKNAIKFTRSKPLGEINIHCWMVLVSIWKLLECPRQQTYRILYFVWKLSKTDWREKVHQTRWHKANKKNQTTTKKLLFWQKNPPIKFVCVTWANLRTTRFGWRHLNRKNRIRTWSYWIGMTPCCQQASSSLKTQEA